MSRRPCLSGRFEGADAFRDSEAALDREADEWESSVDGRLDRLLGLFEELNQRLSDFYRSIISRLPPLAIQPLPVPEG